MKLRFYLRGLGFGIVFSAIICSLGNAKASEQPMSDSEVIARAKELGMVEGTVLSQQGEIDADYTAQLNENEEFSVLDETLEDTEELPATEESESSVEESLLEKLEESETEVSKEEATEESLEKTESKEQTESELAQESEGLVEESKEPEVIEESETPAQTVPTGEIVTIVVNSGSGSYTVAASCESAGLVESAKDFDTYLCSNGYGNRISVGTFEIPAGSDYETIAKILTKSR